MRREAKIGDFGTAEGFGVISLSHGTLGDVSCASRALADTCKVRWPYLPRLSSAKTNGITFRLRSTVTLASCGPVISSFLRLLNTGCLLHLATILLPEFLP